MTISDVLAKVASNEITPADAATLINALKPARAASALTCKVSEKGGLSVYGLGRWPVTLYRGQWERLLAQDTVTKINDFIKANAASLATKE